MTAALLRAAGDPALHLIAWLLTCLLHSTFLLGGVWLLLRVQSVRPAWEEILWRLAFFGSLVTATVHSLVDLDPIESWELGPPRLARDAWAQHWPVPIAAAWLCVAFILLTRLALRQRRLFRAFRGRRRVVGAPLDVLRAVARPVGLGRRVRLTALAGLPTPVALGLREVVVPEEVLADLDPDLLHGVLAHEVAHLARRDPIWSLTSGIVEALLFFQPLLRVARRRLRVLAERRADSWAAYRTGSALIVARGLERVAAVAIAPESCVAAPAAVGEDPSALVARIRSLLEPVAGEDRPVTAFSRLWVVSAVLILAIVAFPSFAPHEELDGHGEWRPFAARLETPGNPTRSPIAILR